MMEDMLAQRWVGAGVQAGWGHYPSSYALVRCLMEYQRYPHCDRQCCGPGGSDPYSTL